MAEAKNVAAKSSVIVCTMIGVCRTNLRPSLSAAKLTRDAAAPAFATARPVARIAISAAMTARYDAALMP